MSAFAGLLFAHYVNYILECIGDNKWAANNGRRRRPAALKQSRRGGGDDHDDYAAIDDELLDQSRQQRAQKTSSFRRRTSLPTIPLRFDKVIRFRFSPTDPNLFSFIPDYFT